MHAFQSNQNTVISLFAYLSHQYLTKEGTEGALKGLTEESLMKGQL